MQCRMTLSHLAPVSDRRMTQSATWTAAAATAAIAASASYRSRLIAYTERTEEAAKTLTDEQMRWEIKWTDVLFLNNTL